MWPWKRRELWKGVFGQGEPTSPRSPGSGLEWDCITGRLRWFAHCLDPDWWTSVLTAHLPVQMAPQTGSTEKETQPVSAFLQLFTWEEIRSHNGRGQSREQWLVIDRKVYDVSKFSKHHPGGSRVISHYAGQDATVRSRRLVEEGGSIGRAGWHGGAPVESAGGNWHRAWSDKVLHVSVPSVKMPFGLPSRSGLASRSELPAVQIVKLCLSSLPTAVPEFSSSFFAMYSCITSLWREKDQNYMQ